VLTTVKAGRGIGRVLSYQSAEEVATGKLVRLLPETEPAALPVHVVVSSKRHMAPKLRAFLDHAVAALEALPVIRTR